MLTKKFEITFNGIPSSEFVVALPERELGGNCHMLLNRTQWIKGKNDLYQFRVNVQEKSSFL